MKTTVTLTDENAAGLAWAVNLTGLSLEEIVNLLLASELTCFRPDDELNDCVLTLQPLQATRPAGRDIRWPIAGLALGYWQLVRRKTLSQGRAKGMDGNSCRLS